MLKAAQAQNSGASLAPLGRWGDERSPDDDNLVQIMLVAGACNQLVFGVLLGRCIAAPKGQPAANPDQSESCIRLDAAGFCKRHRTTNASP